ncbi:3-hydroxyacyl-CoA dehydrogenase [Salicibibacter cibarius]|uniref:3-hydroxyacyl-CoA dehydrogenase n=1 Tax=Salicibibacter cibarius TaxID=2743000 RepID=A0A7T6Z6J2_9BACI|nr:3-hydroxyacyl-CoA dehydrogenase NAD-binding domain-containing protein [Salicibibacter cibarius]QQK77799.1 3-hydroxyacyl-CoA dehydrogenase [Salicibibacter cibarius]
MKKISVVGAGTMGRGIAYTAALSGFGVQIQDIDEGNLQQAKTSIEELLQKSVDKGFIAVDVAEVAKQQIGYESDLQQAVREADVVIEAVLEEIPLKVYIFQNLDKYCSEHTVLATNTSTLSPTEIGAATNRPDKVIAMHFFNPVHKMKLIELIKGLDTSEDTVQIVQDLGEKMNKETVEVNEFPGFVTSRMNCLIGNEAMNMYMEGVASAKDIDKALKLGLNHPMGPLELADLVGLDSRFRNMNYLYETLGEKYRPCPLLIKYVKAGKLGRKSGEGFYKY